MHVCLQKKEKMNDQPPDTKRDDSKSEALEPPETKRDDSKSKAPERRKKCIDRKEWGKITAATISTKDDFVRAAQAIWGTKYNYDAAQFVALYKKVTGIVCVPCSHPFDQMGRLHLRGFEGCKQQCKNKQRRKTVENFIETADLLHPGKFGYDRVSRTYVNRTSKVEICCFECQEYFWQTAAGHLAGSGCTDCSFKQMALAQRKTTDQFIEEAQNLHGDGYDYSMVVYVNWKTVISLICKKCAVVFEQTPSAHLSGHGCSPCAYRKNGLAKRKTWAEFVMEAKQMHGELYFYPEDGTYVGSDIKVSIFCERCNEWFQQTPHGHLAGKGCSKCGGTSLKTQEQFLKEVRLKHGDKYDYGSAVYIGTLYPVEIKCKKCKQTYVQIAWAHLQGHGCFRCANARQYSKAAIEWIKTIATARNIHIQHQENGGEYRILDSGRRWKADGYYHDGSTREIFEFYGDWWHGNPKLYPAETWNSLCKKTMGQLYDNTMERENKLRALGYKLTVIWEQEWKLQKAATLIEEKKGEGNKADTLVEEKKSDGNSTLKRPKKN